MNKLIFIFIFVLACTINLFGNPFRNCRTDADYEQILIDSFMIKKYKTERVLIQHVGFDSDIKGCGKTLWIKETRLDTAYMKRTAKRTHRSIKKISNMLNVSYYDAVLYVSEAATGRSPNIKTGRAARVGNN